MVSVKRGEDIDAEASVAAQAIGEAIAQAYARAEVILEVDGAGEAFGSAQADVRAVAEASATVSVITYSHHSNSFSCLCSYWKPEMCMLRPLCSTPL